MRRAARRFPRKSTLLDIYSRTVNFQRPLSEIVTEAFPWCEDHVEAMSILFKAYTARKRSLGALDLDDLLLYWRALVADEVDRSLVGGPVRPRADRRVSGRQRSPGRDRPGAFARSAGTSPRSATTSRRSTAGAPRRRSTFSAFRSSSRTRPSSRSSATTARCSRCSTPRTRSPPRPSAPSRSDCAATCRTARRPSSCSSAMRPPSRPRCASASWPLGSGAWSCAVRRC